MNPQPLLVTAFTPASPRVSEPPQTTSVEHCSDAELLALLLSDGTSDENALAFAERILMQYNGLAGLAQASASDLQPPGGATCTALRHLLAIAEFARRIRAARHEERPLIRNAADAAGYVSDMAELPQENVRVLLLDSAHRVIASPTVYIGTMHLAVLRTSEVFREAVVQSSAAIILAHNHPSGDPLPSPEDVEMTHALAAAGNLLEIALVDHIIISRRGWVSLREQGFLR